MIAWQACLMGIEPGDGSAFQPQAEPVILGTQMAAARAAEARHQAESREPSPLADVSYGGPGGELSLLHFSVVPSDEIIDEFVAGFASRGHDAREAIRARLGMDDLYTLLTYARRTAVRALRSSDHDVAGRGVTALAIIDLDRVDWRDLAWQAGILSWTIGRIGGDIAAAFEAAASLASGETAELLSGRAQSPAAELSDWGFREVRTGDGIGLVEDDNVAYEPASDLIGLAEAVAAGMAGDSWQLSDPMTGSDLPAVWLGGGTQDDTGPALRAITGCVRLRGTPSDQNLPGAHAQSLLVFLADTGEDAPAASAVARAAGPGPGSAFAGIGVAAGTRCAVMIARSFVQGIPSRETQESLERFRDVLTTALTGSG